MMVNRWEINHLSNLEKMEFLTSIWSLHTRYLLLWVLTYLVLEILSLTQSIIYFSIVTLIFWFFHFLLLFFLWLLAAVVLGHTTQIRDIPFSENSLRNWHFEPQLLLQLHINGSCGTATNLAAYEILALWLKECPDVKIFLGEHIPPPNYFI